MDADGLYALPAEEFVAARGALVKALRAAGRRDEARDVAALRRPSVAAAAVNRVVRARGAALDELFAAGDALRAAQADLLAGRGGRDELREATAAQRAAAGRLVADARALAAEHGEPPTPAVLEKVAETLQAAALDDEARAAVRQGRLTRELRHVGLGFGDGSTSAPPRARRAAAPKERKTAKKPKAKDAAKAKAEAEAKAAAERAEREREAARVALRRKVDAARRRVETTTRRVERAQAALDTAQSEAQDAAAALEDAERRLDEA